jgi:hypothetical protein
MNRFDDKNRRAVAEPLESRRLLSSVIAVGPEISVTPTDPYGSDDPATALDTRGDFVIVWNQSSLTSNAVTSVYGQRYDPAGNPLGSAFRVNTDEVHSDAYPRVAMDPAGDFVVTWASHLHDGDGYGVYAQRYNSAGTPQGSEFRVNTYTSGDQSNPSVAIDDHGNFVIAWGSYFQDGSYQGIYAQRYNSVGTPQGGEFRVNNYTSSQQYYPSVAMDGAGDFVIAWEGEGSGNSQGTYARRYNLTGVAQGNQFLVNPTNPDAQFGGTVRMGHSGNFLIAWGDNSASLAQRYSANGTAEGNVISLGAKFGSVAMDSSGDFVMIGDTYSDADDYRHLVARRYDASGTPLGNEFQVVPNTAFVTETAAMDATGDFIVAWWTGGSQELQRESYAQRFAIVPEVTAPSFGSDTAPQHLDFTFNHDVSNSLGADDLLVQNLTTGQTIPSQDFSLSYNTSTNAATFSYAGGILPDGNYRAALLSAGIATPQGASMAADYGFDFSVLAGDANHDGKVDVTDLGILATNWQGSGMTFSQGDFNYDGVVDVSDLGILATNWQKSLPLVSLAMRARSTGTSSPTAGTVSPFNVVSPPRRSDPVTLLSDVGLVTQAWSFLDYATSCTLRAA